MHNFAATFDTQLSPVAPFLFYLVIGLIIFIETGLLIGFFLPGDSLLFSAGLVAAARDDINIVILISVVFLAAFIGDQVGYVIARYIPWVRTFVPPIAGTVKMNYYKFLSANALGAFLWGVGITLAGFYSGSIDWVKDISYFLAAFFITGSIISAIINYRRDRRL